MAEPTKQRILLSLKPRFAQAILNGVKTVELRRQRVAAQPGATLFIYSSSPVMAIVGTVELREVVIASPSEIWRRFNHRLGLTHDEYLGYLSSSREASALIVSDPRPWIEPIGLEEIRAFGKFQPPQSYRYFSTKDELVRELIMQRKVTRKIPASLKREPLEGQLAL